MRTVDVVDEDSGNDSGVDSDGVVDEEIVVSSVTTGSSALNADEPAHTTPTRRVERAPAATEKPRKCDVNLRMASPYGEGAPKR